MSERQAFRAPPGTHDVLPPESGRWQRALAIVAEQMRRHGFGLAVGPLFEDVGVFRRLGDGTDVVSKEMYEFHDRGDRHLALRPESTASVCRAFAQHRPVTPWKVWYASPHFRYERAQAGRYRQHHQVGAEVLGSTDPDVDVEVIGLAAAILADIGLERILLVINSMGDHATRATYAAELTEFLRDVEDRLAPEDQVKIDTHPLRVLDSKREDTKKAVVGAPRINDFLSDEAFAHFERVQEGLRALDITFAVDHRLVRGLDYYTHTTFEFQSSAISAAQSTVCGGGRYDGLVEQLGGPPTPGIGFGMGIERLLMAADAEQTLPAPTQPIDVFVVDVVDGRSAQELSVELRRSGMAVERAFDHRSMRSQMKSADRSGAAVAVIVGDSELAVGAVTVRDLRGSGAQRQVPRADMATVVAGMLDSSETEQPQRERYEWLGGAE